MNFKQIATYYFVLLLFMVLWTSRIAAPPALLRSLFFIAVVLPGTHDRHGLFLAAILYFWTVSVYGYAYWW